MRQAGAVTMLKQDRCVIAGQALWPASSKQRPEVRMRTPAFVFALIRPLTWSGGTTVERTPRDTWCNRETVPIDNKSYLAIKQDADGCWQQAAIVSLSCHPTWQAPRRQ